ncbi:MAG: rhamnulokinase [Lachnospiraceae bacterium]|nr:rhamnulokinase [Lachnospiraceae bacterium]
MPYYLAIDIGASSGRHILGFLENGKMQLEEVYRFENGMKEKDGHLCWDSEYLFSEIKNGLKRCKEIRKIPVSMGIDTWGVDFVLINEQGERIGEAVGYRDHRTDGIREKLDPIISQEELYERTGIAFQPYNTLNQLVALKINEAGQQTPGGRQLPCAKSMLMTPDYYNYLLTGKAKQEYTIASTSQMLDVHTGGWDEDLIDRCGLPGHLFLPPQMPGTLNGRLRPEVAGEVGFDCDVVMVASHDTASAVMAVPCLEEKALYISSGTWSLMGSESSDPANDPESMRAGFTNEGGYGKKYRYLKNIMGLWMIQSVRNEIGREKSFGEICEMAARETITSLVDCNDDRFLSPKSMVEAVQEYCRETGQQVPETLSELACVIYNSLAKCYGETKEQIERLTGKNFDRIYIIGGGSNAEYLNQLTANYAGCEVSAGPTEATAIGNLMCQMIRDGQFRDLTEARQCVINSFAVKYYQCHCK